MWLFYIFDIIIYTRLNKGVGNRIHVPNTDPSNNRDINKCSIIIFNKIVDNIY